MTVRSFAVPPRVYLELTTGTPLWPHLHASRQVDSLLGYTREMFEILKDFLASECGIGFPTHRLLPAPDLGNVPAVVECLRRHDARVLQTKLDRSPVCRRLRRNSQARGSFFGYGLEMDACELHEYQGIEYLKRQTDHFREEDDYLLIVATDEMP